MSTDHTVSVIVPVYNRHALLRRALQSVCRQTVPVNEVIVVDDGSDANNRVNADDFPQLNIKILTLPHCGKAGKVRNYGAWHAQGTYLAFLDSDDQWLEHKIQQQLLAHTRNPHIVISHTREQWVRAGKTVMQPSVDYRKSGDIFAASLKKCIMGPSTVMLRADMFRRIGGFRQDLEIAEDYELWIRITKSYSVMFLDDALTIKHGGVGDNLSEKYGYIEPFRLDALIQLLHNTVFTKEQSCMLIKEAQRKARICIAGALKRGKDVAKYTHILKSLSQLDKTDK